MNKNNHPNKNERIKITENAIRRKIRQYCTDEQLSLHAFALGAGVAYSTLRDFVILDKTEPKLGTLVMIADYMGISLSELVRIEDSG